jgi:hypothetical protein
VWIIDPTQSRPDLKRQPGGGPNRGVDLSGRVCLLSNSKPNAAPLLEGMADRLGLTDTMVLAKPAASRPAPEELLERVAADFDEALVAIAD